MKTAIPILTALVSVALSPSPTIASYTVIHLGGNPLIKASVALAPGVGDLDCDGHMEIITRNAGDNSRVDIYDLTTGALEYAANTGITGQIVSIYVLPAIVGGSSVGLIQTDYGETGFYLIFDSCMTSGLGEYSTPRAQPQLLGVPNPITGQTQINFTLHAAGVVTLDVYDVTGRLVRSLFNGSLPAGAHAIQWDAADASGRPVPSGEYFYRLYLDGSPLENNKAVVVR
jgi:hypothetical protein